MAGYIPYILSAIITFMILIAVFYRFWFLRKPKRLIPTGEVIISPANGKIVRIIDIDGKDIRVKKGLIGKIRTLTKDTTKKGWLIVIRMTPLNVHFQRAPFDGKVLDVRYKKGKLFNAVIGAENMEATLMNEKNEILIKTKFGNIKVIQVAGFVANRIKCFVNKNQNIKKGQIIGLIKLGSQVCLLMPKNGFTLLVKECQNIIDGETIIAKRGK